MSAFLSVDGVEFCIYDPSPFSSCWWSHKLNQTRLRYEIGVSISNGQIVWASGPWPCGKYTDLTIFRCGFEKLLDDNEFVVEDSGYTDLNWIKPSGKQHPSHYVLSKIRTHHECINGRIKQFFCLSHRFRHSLELHHKCFFAVLKVVFLTIASNPMFDVDLPLVEYTHYTCRSSPLAALNTVLYTLRFMFFQ